MKLTSTKNPHDVQIGQVWTREGRSRFTVIDLEKFGSVTMAIAQYKEKGRVIRTTKINLASFGRYTRIK